MSKDKEMKLDTRQNLDTQQILGWFILSGVLIVTIVNDSVQLYMETGDRFSLNYWLVFLGLISYSLGTYFILAKKRTFIMNKESP